jgi:hypothetical protein
MVIGGRLAMAVLVVAAAALAAGAAEKVRVQDLDWLAGRWVGEMAGGGSEEIWSQPDSGSMMGMWRWSQGGAPRLFEFMTIQDADEGPVLRLRHIEPSGRSWESQERPLELPLVRHGPREASFAGANRDGSALVLTYKCPNPDRLTVVLEEASGVQEFHFRRR